MDDIILTIAENYLAENYIGTFSETWDEHRSIQSFALLAEKSLRENYPGIDVTINIAWGVFSPVPTMISGRDDPWGFTADIRNILNRVVQSGDWMVELDIGSGTKHPQQEPGKAT